MEYLLGLLLRFPAFWQSLGVALTSVSLGAIGLGLRLGRRIDRAEHTASRVGSAIELHIDKLLPWWLSPFVPESALGFITWATLAACGLILALTARKIRRLTR